MNDRAFARLTTLVGLVLTAIAVSDTAERQWRRWQAHRAQVAGTHRAVPAQRDPAWFAQARREIDWLTHGPP